MQRTSPTTAYGLVLAALLAFFYGLAVAAMEPAPPAAAADTTSLGQQIRTFLEATYPAAEPGAAVIIVRDGEVVFRDAFGMADLELGVELRPEMVFRLGSITKQFTGAAILLLQERGLLSVDDPITRFLPDYPVHGHTITIAHLLAHTSGIRSYTGIPGWMSTRIKSDMSVEELIDGFRNEPMDFAPGERFLYNNSGYVLLGAIIEKASGKTYAEFLEENIFEPLGMHSTSYEEHDRIIPRRARGYGGTPAAYQNAQYFSMTQPYAAGSLLSTVDDLALWNAALVADRLLAPASRQAMVTPFRKNDGSSTDYSYGLAIGELRGRPSVSHGGGIFGFTTYALRLPEERVYVAVLSNNTAHPTSTAYVAQKIAALVIGDPFAERTSIQLAPEALGRYTGVYRIDASTTRTVTLEGGQLYTERTGGTKLPIVPESETDFFYQGSFSHLSFVADASGPVTHMLFYQDDKETPERADRTDEPLPPKE